MPHERGERKCIIEYRLTDRGTSSDEKSTPAGKIVSWMKEGHGVANEHEVNYELEMTDSKVHLESLVKAGYLSKEEESEQFGMF